MTEQTGHYIHGTDPDEQRRLSLLNGLLNEASLGALRLEGHERVLDVGSGLGQLSRAMARVVGPGRVVGVERDPQQLAEAQRQAEEDGEANLVDFRRGEAADLPLTEDERGAFDLAHTRFLLEHVPDPQRVVDSMVAALRPGGRIVLEDDDHDLLRLWPEVPNFNRVWNAYLRTYDQLGNDPYVGRRLVSLLEQAGAEPVRNDMLFFGSCAGNPSFQVFVDNFAGLIEGAADTILAKSSLSQTELEETLAAFKSWGLRSDAAMWYATCWAEARTRETRAGARRPREGATSDLSGTAPRARPRSTVSSMAFLAESAADLTSSLRLEEVFRKIAERVQQLVDCHLFCVMLWNEPRQLLEHSYSVRFGEPVEQTGGFPLGYGLSGSAAADRRPIRVADVREDSRYIRFRHAEVDIRSELAVPLVLRDRLIGVLDLESQQLDAFTEEHEQIVTALASHIATALENARLYEELAEREDLMESDLATARQIQKGLLPAEPPTVDGLEIGAAFAPARELSGDFYDFLRYPDGRVAFVVGDVAGKSTAAALYGTLAVGVLRGHALEHFCGPGELLTHLNQHLYPLNVERRFVALTYAVWDPDTATLEIGNAGCPHPYLVRDGSVDNVEVGGVPTGALADSSYEVVKIQLEPGDLVLLCSDGIEDCEDARGQRLADQRLPEFLAAVRELPAQEIANDLVALTVLHTGGESQFTDDRTVVAVRRVG
jgi:serine phosphatase RsbU (regulator of sigma subunit)/SAM-dependent methyltransferase